MRILSILFILLITVSCSRGPSAKDLFEEYLWQKRVMVLFSPSFDDPYYKQQVQIINNNVAALAERDLVVWVVVTHEAVIKEGKVLPHMGTPKFYRGFDMPAYKFGFVLLDKDGEEKLRVDKHLSIKEITSRIDAMPSRQKEIRENAQYFRSIK